MASKQCQATAAAVNLLVQRATASWQRFSTILVLCSEHEPVLKDKFVASEIKKKSHDTTWQYFSYFYSLFLTNWESLKLNLKNSKVVYNDTVTFTTITRKL